MLERPSNATEGHQQSCHVGKDWTTFRVCIVHRFCHRILTHIADSDLHRSVFGLHAHLRNVQVKFVYESHRVSVRVTGYYHTSIPLQRSLIQTSSKTDAEWHTLVRLQASCYCAQDVTRPAFTVPRWRLSALDRHRPPITAIGWCLDVCHNKNTNASRRQEFFRRRTVSLELSACRITWQRYLTCTV